MYIVEMNYAQIKDELFIVELSYVDCWDESY